MTKPLKAVLLSVLVFAGSATSARAVPPPDTISNPALGPGLGRILEGPNPGATFVAKLVANFINLGFIIGVVIFVFMFLWGGISWMQAGQDKGQIEEARGRVIQALVGLLILFALYAIIQIVESVLGLKILTLDIESLIIR